MKPYYDGQGVTLWHGDCLDVLATLPDCSVDAVVTDPPYGLEFMGKEWDAPWQESDVNADAGFHGGGIDATKGLPSSTGSTNPKCITCKGTRRGRRDGTAKVAVCLCDDGGRFPNTRAIEMRAFQQWCEQWAAECLRVLKPGGHLLAFGGTRTWHRLTCAVEDAGFEIRDSIAWLYGSGFPKSLNVGKAIDRHRCPAHVDSLDHVCPPAPEAEAWRGHGTAAKPAFEPVVVARKPLAGTVAANVTAYGTGALNVDACRIGNGDDRISGGRQGWAPQPMSWGETSEVGRGLERPSGGRWPANVVLDEHTARALDEQSGTLTSGKMQPTHTTAGVDGRASAYGKDAAGGFTTMETYGDTGGASRFFYVAKADANERPRVPKQGADAQMFAASIRKRCSKCGKQEVNMGTSACTCPEPDFQPDPGMSGTHVSHPTVKPLTLMRWLVRLVTPPGGTVLEPFAGSGTTVEACLLEGLQCIAIEKETEYLPLVLTRIHRQRDPVQAIRLAGEDLGLFDLDGFSA